MTTATTTTSDWLSRVLALVPLTTLALLWSNHHLGAGAGHPGIVAAVAAALTVVMGIVDKVLDKAEQESVAARFRLWMENTLSWQRILLAYLAVAIVALVWTSVVVIPDEAAAQGPVQIRLVAADDRANATKKDLEPKGEPVHFIVASYPFGRTFRLDVEGYVPESFEVYPIVGRRVRPGKDLRRSPTVLLRLSELALGSFKDQTGGELVVSKLGAEGSVEIIARSRTPGAAFLLGRKQPVPGAYSAHWRTELLAKGIKDETLVAKHLVGWKDPRVLQPTVVLEPGMQLRVRVVNSAGNAVATSEFVLGDGELQDQSVEDLG